MTAFNVSVNTNWDAQSGGSVNATLDTYTISAGATLTIRTDSYQCAGHSAAFGSLDTVSFSGIGGKLRIDGTQVRVIPFNTGSSTVPAIGTAITQGGVSSALLGVWANWQSEPVAAGAAMPATGWIKVLGVTGGSYAAGALTGITATATGADRVGWIEVRGADTAQITVPRVGTVEIVGDWFELGVTSGARGQVLECPTTATVAGVFPGVWIETAAGSGVYERFSGAGSIVAAATIPTDERGKIVWQTTGGIRIGSDGTNNVGFLPPTGCRVRIPNVILTCCTRTVSGSGPRVLPNATLATRQEFVTTSAGAINIQDCVCQWYANFSQPFSIVARDSAFSDTLVLSEVASPLDVDNIIVAPTQAQLNLAFNITSCFAGGNFRNALGVRFSLAASGAYVNQANFVTGVVFENVKSMTLTNRANATTGTWTSSRASNCEWKNCVNIGGRLVLITARALKVTSLAYADNFSGVTGTTNPHYAIEPSGGTSNLTVSGISFLGTNLHPYNGLVLPTASYDTTVRNIGTFAAPLNMGSANASGAIIISGGNNDGIRLQRCYVSNTRTSTHSFANSDTRVVLESVFGDYADAPVMAALNATQKGCGSTPATTGQVSVYGTHWVDSFLSATTGRVQLLCNEPTTASAAQCQVTSGTPRFNSSGSVLLTTVGDQVTWEMPYRALGHTSFQNVAPTLTGTNTGNHTLEYQIDTGSGFSAWKALSAANLAAETISPSSGFKLKLRATCATANATNALTNIAIQTNSSSVAQSGNLYPLDTISLTLTGLQPGSDVVILQAGTVTERNNVGNNPGSSFTYTYETPETVDVCVFKPGFVPFAIRDYPLGNSNASLPIAQVIDRGYANP